MKIKGQKIGERSGKYINCEVCDTPRYFYRYQFKLQNNFYCSLKCKYIASKGKPTWLSKHAKKGIRMNTGRTQFKKGMKTWNKGIHTGIKPWLGKKRSEETKRKMSEGRKGKGLGFDASKKWRELNPNKVKKNMRKAVLTQQKMKTPTSLEKAVYDYLLLKGLIFEKQKLINGKFIVDAYIPSLNVIIEADGLYWHSQENIQKKDKAENAYLNKCGFKLIRLTEEEIKSGKFTERLVL